MLVAEYDYDTDIAIQRAEEREIAFAEGIEEGAYQKARESASILKQLRCDIVMIAQATGLSQAEIEAL